MTKAKATPTVKEQIIELLLNTKREGIKDLVAYLEKSDYFTSPASSMYHGAFEGGLALHCLNVFNVLSTHYAQVLALYNIPEISTESITIVALLHDLCKCNTYHASTKNVKNEQGVWEQVPYFKKDAIFPMGHGGKSVFIAQNFIKLTPEEAQAIFWHMGAFDHSEYLTWHEMGKAFNENQLAFLLHSADMLATHIVENEFLLEN